MGRPRKSFADRLAQADRHRLRDLAAVRQRIAEAEARGERPNPADLALGLELSFGHTLSIADWGRLLRGLLPHEYRAPLPPALPTSTPPGSKRRALIYASRADAGRALWHPEDVSAGEAQAAAERFVAVHQAARRRISLEVDE